MRLQPQVRGALGTARWVDRWSQHVYDAIASHRSPLRAMSVKKRVTTDVYRGIISRISRPYLYLHVVACSPRLRGSASARVPAEVLEGHGPRGGGRLRRVRLELRGGGPRAGNAARDAI